MKFGKRYSKVTVVMAMLHGVLIGVSAVAIIGLLLVGMKGKGDVGTAEEELAISGPAPIKSPAPATEKPLQLFAKQHGVFSTQESAALFIAENPSLSKAAVVQANAHYFVWSAIGLTEDEIEVSKYEGTYRKAFTVDMTSCGAIGAGKLRDIMTETEVSKIKLLVSPKKKGEEEGDLKEFKKNIATITAFTEDLQIIRLHLLSHYSRSDKCVKITF
ncbi:hypothetical protein [Sporosarcina limicola]|uniref:Uncharacterized protein n=1 Tax=Sporosarcina limicola TaxID=34101 RepID=A0A927MIQ3_9BACL|nr:hypothetical protein [Sporosarcina limicola]MBE1554571.1 hypothetical protein [Sporosarcina limicola]